MPKKSRKVASTSKLNVLYPDEHREYRDSEGRLHRLDGPAVTWADGTEMWYRRDKLHRMGGPAVTTADKGRAWFCNGKRHRVGGPALMLNDGTEEWWFRGQPHRLDGPAVIHAGGYREWWINGQQLDQFTHTVYASAKGKVTNKVKRAC